MDRRGRWGSLATFDSAISLPLIGPAPVDAAAWIAGGAFDRSGRRFGRTNDAASRQRVVGIRVDVRPQHVRRHLPVRCHTHADDTLRRNTGATPLADRLIGHAQLFRQGLQPD